MTDSLAVNNQTNSTANVDSSIKVESSRKCQAITMIVLAILVGGGGLLVGTMGLAEFPIVNTIGQTGSIAFMAAGGVTYFVLLIVGSVRYHNADDVDDGTSFVKVNTRKSPRTSLTPSSSANDASTNVASYTTSFPSITASSLASTTPNAPQVGTSPTLASSSAAHSAIPMQSQIASRAAPLSAPSLQLSNSSFANASDGGTAKANQQTYVFSILVPPPVPTTLSLPLITSASQSSAQTLAPLSSMPSIPPVFSAPALHAVASSSSNTNHSNATNAAQSQAAFVLTAPMARPVMPTMTSSLIPSRTVSSSASLSTTSSENEAPHPLIDSSSQPPSKAQSNLNIVATAQSAPVITSARQNVAKFSSTATTTLTTSAPLIQPVLPTVSFAPAFPPSSSSSNTNNNVSSPSDITSTESPQDSRKPLVESFSNTSLSSLSPIRPVTFPGKNVPPMSSSATSSENLTHPQPLSLAMRASIPMPTFSLLSSTTSKAVSSPINDHMPTTSLQDPNPLIHQLNADLEPPSPTMTPTSYGSPDHSVVWGSQILPRAPQLDTVAPPPATSSSTISVAALASAQTSEYPTSPSRPPMPSLNLPPRALAFTSSMQNSVVSPPAYNSRGAASPPLRRLPLKPSAHPSQPQQTVSSYVRQPADATSNTQSLPIAPFSSVLGLFAFRANLNTGKGQTVIANGFTQPSSPGFAIQHRTNNPGLFDRIRHDGLGVSITSPTRSSGAKKEEPKAQPITSDATSPKTQANVNESHVSFDDDDHPTHTHASKAKAPSNEAPPRTPPQPPRRYYDIES